MKSTVFRTAREGAATVFGPLEGAIMDVLWKAGAACTVSEVHTALDRLGRPLSYSAVKAVLNNLVTKGHLNKGILGKATLFKPKRDREAFQADVVRTVVKSLKQNFGQAAIVQLVDEMASDEAALDAFAKLIAAKKKASK